MIEKETWLRNGVPLTQDAQAEVVEQLIQDVDELATLVRELNATIEELSDMLDYVDFSHLREDPLAQLKYDVAAVVKAAVARIHDTLTGMGR